MKTDGKHDDDVVEYLELEDPEGEDQPLKLRRLHKGSTFLATHSSDSGAQLSSCKCRQKG